MKQFSDVISAFGSTAVFADAVTVPYQTAAAWKNRDSIPAKYWKKIIQAAEKQKITGITEEALTKIASAKRSA